MSSYRPPYSMLDIIFSGDRESKRKIRANEHYGQSWNREKARSDYRRRR